MRLAASVSLWLVLAILIVRPLVLMRARLDARCIEVIDTQIVWLDIFLNVLQAYWRTKLFNWLGMCWGKQQWSVAANLVIQNLNFFRGTLQCKTLILLLMIVWILHSRTPRLLKFFEWVMSRSDQMSPVLSSVAVLLCIVVAALGV